MPTLHGCFNTDLALWVNYFSRHPAHRRYRRAPIAGPLCVEDSTGRGAVYLGWDCVARFPSLADAQGCLAEAQKQAKENKHIAQNPHL